MDFNALKIRCSSIGKVMTNGRGKDTMGATCTSYLHQLYLENKYNRKKDFTSREMEKGIRMEEQAITLLALQKRYNFKKNSERLSNDFLTGEPDIFIGDSIQAVEEGFDTKCAWSVWTMPDELDKMYYWQNMGYMALTGAKKWTTAYCLVNAPADMIINEKNRMWYALGCPDDTNPKYLDKRREIEKNMIFDIALFMEKNPHFDFDIDEWEYDIPAEERIIEFTVDRDEEAIEAIYQRIRDCRAYMTDKYGKKIAA